MLYFQLLLAIFIILVILSTFKYTLRPIKYILFVQALQMMLSNFNSYDSGTVKQMKAEDNSYFWNYEGMNIIISVFSNMFNIYNSLLITMVFKSR